MKTFIAYEKATGRILSRTISSEGTVVVPDETDSIGIIQDVYVSDSDHYVDVTSLQIVSRSTSVITYSIAGLIVTLQNVPLGATVVVMGLTSFVSDADDGVIQMNFEVAGSYRILARSFPQKDFDVVVALS